MGKGFRDSIRRRRMQRWLRREALLLATEAEAFDCPAMRSEARSLLELATGGGGFVVLRNA